MCSSIRSTGQQANIGRSLDIARQCEYIFAGVDSEDDRECSKITLLERAWDACRSRDSKAYEIVLEEVSQRWAAVVLNGLRGMSGLIEQGLTI